MEVKIIEGGEKKHGEKVALNMYTEENKTWVTTATEILFAGNSNSILSKCQTVYKELKTNKWTNQRFLEFLVGDTKKKKEDVESSSSKFYNVNLVRLCMLEIDWITHVMKTSMR